MMCLVILCYPCLFICTQMNQTAYVRVAKVLIFRKKPIFMCILANDAFWHTFNGLAW